MRTMLSKPTVLLLALILAACEGPTGPQGPEGQAGQPGEPGTSNPYDRAASYCLQGAGVTAASDWSVTIRCAQVTDIPVAGSCYAADLPPGGFIAASRPVDWPNTTQAAGWTCTWAWQQGAEPTGVGFSFGGTAEICCATPQ